MIQWQLDDDPILSKDRIYRWVMAIRLNPEGDDVKERDGEDGRTDL